MSAGNAAAGLSIEEQDVIARKCELDRRADGKERASERHAGEKVLADADLQGGLHAGGHSAIDLAGEIAVLGDDDKFGSDAEYKVTIRQNGFFEQRVVVLDDLRDMAMEHFILVAFST